MCESVRGDGDVCVFSLCMLSFVFVLEVDMCASSCLVCERGREKELFSAGRDSDAWQEGNISLAKNTDFQNSISRIHFSPHE